MLRSHSAGPVTGEDEAALTEEKHILLIYASATQVSEMNTSQAVP